VARDSPERTQRAQRDSAEPLLCSFTTEIGIKKLQVPPLRATRFGRDDNRKRCGSGLGVALFQEEDVEVGGDGFGVELAHHERNLAAVIGGMIRQMLHEVREAELASA